MTAAQGITYLSRVGRLFHNSLIPRKVGGVIGRRGLATVFPASACVLLIPVRTSRNRCSEEELRGSGSPIVIVVMVYHR